MYPNLKAEMARNSVSVADISRATKKTDRCIRNKLSGTSDFTLSETIAIRDTFFPVQSLDYLFTKYGEIKSSA